MKISDLPVRITNPWAESVSEPYAKDVPVPSQQGVLDGKASWTDGFPPFCFNPGGAPWGDDMNGALRQLSRWTRAVSAGGMTVFNGPFAAAIGGYLRGSVVADATSTGFFWLSLKDDNLTDPATPNQTDWMRINGQTINDNRYVSQIPRLDWYVATTGNDITGDGSAGNPYASLYHAQFVIAQYIAPLGVTIHVAAGTYVTGANLGAAFWVRFSLIAQWTIIGASAGSTIIDSTTSGTVGFESFGDTMDISNLTVKSAYFGFVANSGSRVYVHDCNVVMSGVCFAFFAQNAGYLRVYGVSTVSGSGQAVFASSLSGNCAVAAAPQVGVGSFPLTVTFSSCTVAVATAYAANSGWVLAYPSAVTFVNHPTGKKYFAQTTGVVDSNGSGTSFWPGSTGGSVDSGTYGLSF